MASAAKRFILPLGSSQFELSTQFAEVLYIGSTINCLTDKLQAGGFALPQADHTMRLLCS
jgi:hypothetical protein